MVREHGQGIDINVFIRFAIDQHCVKLVHEYQAVDPLIHVVRKATDLKASHAATGVLRNLALAGKCPGILIRSYFQRQPSIRDLIFFRSIGS